MATINIRNPGGLLPSQSPRNLPALDGAQVAENIDGAVPEFRPLTADLEVATSGTIDPKTLYRLARDGSGDLNDDLSGGWLVSPREISYVPGQLDDNSTARTYLTYNDGLNPPRVIDATGQDRQLGVPSPENPPTITLDTVDEFTPDERNAAELALLDQMEAIIRGTQTPVWIGPDHPGTTTDGWADRGDVNAEDPYGQDQIRLFKLTSTAGANDGTVLDTYGSLPADQAGWVLGLPGGLFVTADSGSPPWTRVGAPPYHDHLCIPITSYGKGYEQTAATETQLEALTMPGTGLNGEDATALFTPEQLTDLLDQVDELLDPANEVLKKHIDAIKAAHADVAAVFEGSYTASQTAQVAAFYTDVADAAIDDATEVFAEALWQKAVSIAHAGNTSYWDPGTPG